MTIQRAPKKRSLDDVIDAAPDAKPAASAPASPAAPAAQVVPVKTRKGTMKGSKEQISLTLKPDILARVDVMADRLGIARAAYMSQALVEKLERDGA